LDYRKEDKKIIAKPGESRGYWQLVETNNYDGKALTKPLFNCGGNFWLIRMSKPYISVYAASN